ncbi:hypothetical protein D3H55_22615 [Bacillus salacetis]|uniref:XRE family transcriptional regulator n=1 Tax=Bacillus salacetis TaxID=2315464 RepID=A0A3A1QS02_9BACI|nr:hypothetical protein [Bacillus salacetis]RIW27806.1 hypothetical protein D3H55_22615 [Bacillus salacetis]
MVDQTLLHELKEYIDLHQEELTLPDVCESSYRLDSEQLEADFPKYSSLEEFIIENEQPSFRQELFSHIDEKGLKDPEVYKRAGMDRQHFSKIRSNPDYRIGRNPAIALSLALQLDLDEAEELLNTAGYSLSFSDPFDLVIRFCFEKKIFGLIDVNELLDSVNLKPLTG